MLELSRAGAPVAPDADTWCSFGVRMTELPITPERVLQAIMERQERGGVDGVGEEVARGWISPQRSP